MLDIEAVRNEYRSWEELNDLLMRSGAVTEADSKSPKGSSATPGQRLYNAVKAWGTAVAALKEAECHEKRFAIAVAPATPVNLDGPAPVDDPALSVEDELRRVLRLPAVPRVASDAARRAVHALLERTRQIQLWKTALEGLTPGGSEFVNDPAACAAFVREARDSAVRAVAHAHRQRDEARGAQGRAGTVSAVLTLEDAGELRTYIKEVVLEVDAHGLPRPAARRGMDEEDDKYWLRIDAALNEALGDPDNDYSGDDPFTPTRGGGPSEHDLREAQKLK